LKYLGHFQSALGKALIDDSDVDFPDTQPRYTASYYSCLRCMFCIFHLFTILSHYQISS